MRLNNRKIPKNNLFKKKKINLFKEKKVRKRENRKICVENNDGKCANCLSRDNVAAHHIIYGQRIKDDSFENLIPLCFTCHRKAHDGYYIIEDNKRIFINQRKFILSLLIRLNKEIYEKTILKLWKV